jgi:DNA-binding CsgD family transcriptional regulator
MPSRTLRSAELEPAPRYKPGRLSYRPFPRNRVRSRCESTRANTSCSPVRDYDSAMTDARSDEKGRDRIRPLLSDSDMSAPQKIIRLTERQRACLELVALGFTSKQIGRKLGISHSTVDNHILAATQMLGVPDRREAGRLVAAMAGQQLPRQAQHLPDEHDLAMLAEQVQHSAASGGIRLLPPVGGQINEQNLGHKTIQILSIAVLSTVAVIAMALIISGAFQAFAS